MELTAENYYSAEANFEYMSASQYKDFMGTYGKTGCEAAAMAKLTGEFKEQPSTAMLVGSYVDSYFEGTLEKFKAEHGEIFTKAGSLRADYSKADEMIARVEMDEAFMSCMSGDKQVIMTGEIFGEKWKIKIDSYIPDVAIVDLKVMESLTKAKYVRETGQFLDFIRYWGYDIQGAVYQEIVRQNTGKTLPFIIAGISKEKVTDLELIHVADIYLNEAMRTVEFNMPHIIRIKTGQEEPRRCRVCDYCRITKKLTGPIEIADLAETA